METALNSPVLTSAMWIGLLFLFVYMGRKSQGWKQWEGAIIQAIKIAEKAIPDEGASVGLRRFDRALKDVVNAYENAKGVEPSADLVEQFRQGISMVHARLERDGNL